MSKKSLILPLIVAGTLVAGAVHADAVAQQLFQQGKALMAEGKLAEACPKFQGASELSATAGVRLNLAECWGRLGRTASAWGKYEEALTIALRTGDNEAAELARRGRAELEPKLTYLSVAVAKGVRVEGMEVLRDGQKLPEAAWNTAVPVDPGEHEIVVQAPGRKTWTLKKTVSEVGTRIEVQVPSLVEVDKPVAASPSVAPQSAPAIQPASPRTATSPAGDSDPGASQRTIAYVAGGLGLVGIGVGTYFGLKARSTKGDYEEHTGADGTCLDVRCESLSQNAHSAGNASTVSFVAGGALLVTGVVLWTLAPSVPAKESKARWSPMLGAQMAGIEMRGGW